MDKADPVFAAMEALKAAESEHDRLNEKMGAALLLLEQHREWDFESHRLNVHPAELALLATTPTTLEGLRAKAEYFASTLPAAGKP
jgi:hypothetical protein